MQTVLICNRNHPIRRDVANAFYTLESWGLAHSRFEGLSVQVRVTTVSKTDFTNWLTCPGYAWAMIHQPHLAPPVDATTTRREIDGDRVESLTRSLFPDALCIETDDPDESITLSARALESDAPGLFQPTVCTDRGLVARADLLVREADGWHLIEIKSSAANPEKPKSLIKKYVPDIAFQTLAFEEAGIPIVRSSLLHIDKRYRRNGHLDISNLLTLTDVTKHVAGQREKLSTQLHNALSTLQNADDPAPCNCHRSTRSNRCDLFAYFHPEIARSGTIYQISGIHSHVLRPALDRGVLDMVDWPDDLPLNPRQRRQVELARSRQELVDRASIERFLGTLEAPLWFLDYETFQEPVPRWSGYAPHQQIPFQYSLHVVEPGSGSSHHGYLHTERDVDPVPHLLAHLERDMGPEGSVVVWNKAFEHARNVEMAELQPAWADFLHDVNARMIDLADSVREGWWAHPQFNGSWSLKSVLPVVAPEMAYDHLEISNGGTASERWIQAMIDNEDMMTDEDRHATLVALDEYCHQDSLAMVRIWEHLLDLVTR